MFEIKTEPSSLGLSATVAGTVAALGTLRNRTLLKLPLGHAVPGKCLKTVIFKHLNQSPRKGILRHDPSTINPFPNNADPEIANETVEDKDAGSSASVHQCWMESQRRSSG